jgi:hypothetical protein
LHRRLSEEKTIFGELIDSVRRKAPNITWRDTDIRLSHLTRELS